MNKSVVLTKNLKKYFSAKGGPIKAVDGVNLNVKAGEIFGFLGPNGAGKTTTLRMLTTLIPPDSGEAIVAGFDVQKSQDEVRRNIGYVSQLGGSDRPATGTENLILQGRLYGMSAVDSTERAQELIKLLDLSEFANRIVYSYSGGQRRRLDVALGLMNRPKVLFLDEPTTGLDPQNRANLWNQIKKLKNEGATIFMTTHYLEEADILSDRLAIIDYGKIVAEGTPEALKKQMAFDCITLGIVDHEKNAPQLIKIFKKENFVREITEDDSHLRLCVKDGPSAMPQILRILDAQKITLLTISMSRPTLDDVFLRKTGHSLRDTEATEEGQG